jgi:hypothetical protein
MEKRVFRFGRGGGGDSVIRGDKKKKKSYFDGLGEMLQKNMRVQDAVRNDLQFTKLVKG